MARLINPIKSSEGSFPNKLSENHLSKNNGQVIAWKIITIFVEHKNVASEKVNYRKTLDTRMYYCTHKPIFEWYCS